MQHLFGIAEIDTRIVDTPIIFSSVWTRDESTILIGSSDTDNITSQYYSNLTFSPLRFEDGGTYVYTVTLSPLLSTYILETAANITFSVSVEPYPVLNIIKLITNEPEMQNMGVTLIGIVILLNNTAPGYTLNYTWSRQGREILSSGAVFMEENVTLFINDVYEGAGTYTLVICLSIPKSGSDYHCSSKDYNVIPTGLLITEYSTYRMLFNIVAFIQLYTTIIYIFFFTYSDGTCT